MPVSFHLIEVLLMQKTDKVSSELLQQKKNGNSEILAVLE